MTAFHNMSYIWGYNSFFKTSALSIFSFPLTLPNVIYYRIPTVAVYNYSPYLNFADPDKVSILLNDVPSFQGLAVFEPGEGGRWDSRCRAFQLQWTVHCDGELLWRAGDGHLWRLWSRDRQKILALLFTCLSLLTWTYRVLCDYQARWDWRFLCCFQPDYWPHSCTGQHLRGQHLAAGVLSPVHPAGGYGAETVAGHPLTKWGWEEEHPGLHRIVSPRSPGLSWQALLVQYDPHPEALRITSTHREAKLLHMILEKSRNWCSVMLIPWTWTS